MRFELSRFPVLPRVRLPLRTFSLPWARGASSVVAPRGVDGLPTGRRGWAMFALSIALTMAVLDGAIANIALPTITGELHSRPSSAIWVVNAYQLAVTISLLPLASAGELYGYRRIFIGGLAVFTLGSLACAYSPSLPWLIVARVVQGFGGAGIMAINNALLRFIYPRQRLGRGIGINALVAATSAAVAPTVAAGILSVAVWQWLFLINVPLGLVALGLANGALPNTPTAHHRFDWLSAVLSAAFFGLLVTGIDDLEAFSRLVVAVLSGAVITGGLFVLRQMLLPYPMLAVGLFRRPVFALSVLTSVCSFAAASLALVILPFYLQGVLGRSAVETGLLITPWPVAVGIIAPVAGRLADRWPAGILGGIGLALLTAGLVLLALLPSNPAALDMVWRMALCGLGFGFFQSPNNRTLLASAPPERAGSASGILASARLVGQTVGTALAGLMLALAGAAAGGIGRATVWALLLGAAFSGIGSVVSSLRLFGYRQAELRPRSKAEGPTGEATAWSPSR
ncbi:MAG: MFS transporter [Alphaproteobacteria bacterium]|nr:MFS transporter [Alphaproteobacteria bacterium]